MEDVNLLLSYVATEIENGKKTLRGGVIVDGENVLNLINRIRVAVGSMNGDALVAEANDKAKKIVAMAEQRRAQLLDENIMTSEAKAIAAHIVDEAIARRDKIEDQVKKNLANMLLSVRNDLVEAAKSVDESLSRVTTDKNQ